MVKCRSFHQQIIQYIFVRIVVLLSRFGMLFSFYCTFVYGKKRSLHRLSYIFIPKTLDEILTFVFQESKRATYNHASYA
jgi:hypothetical protein